MMPWFITLPLAKIPVTFAKAIHALAPWNLRQYVILILIILTPPNESMQGITLANDTIVFANINTVNYTNVNEPLVTL